MLINTNIDRSDEKPSTNAPFEYGCKLSVLGHIFKASDFFSIRLQCPEIIKPPVRLHSIVVDEPSKGWIVFRDTAGALVGRAAINSNSVYGQIPGLQDFTALYLYNENDVLVGHLVCQKNLPSVVLSLMQGSDGVLYTNEGDFVLMTQCLVSSFSGHARAFRIRNAYITCSFTISSGTPQIEIIGSTGSYSACSVNIKGTAPSYATAENSGITSAAVSGGTSIPANGMHLFIRHRVESNLRVSMEGNNIKMKGVKDE